METATRPVPFRPELVDPSTHATAPARSVTVTATYFLSEEGRKASLLAGGNGRSVQRIEIAVPSNRLHLVGVNRRGVARLKLQPRYELTADQRLVCIDAPPVYDAPPTIEDLIRAAARNHQLESAFHAERNRLVRAGGRRTEGDAPHLLEGIAVVVYDPDSGRLDPALPSKDTGLRWPQFVETLANAYNTRFGEGEIAAPLESDTDTE